MSFIQAALRRRVSGWARATTGTRWDRKNWWRIVTIKGMKSHVRGGSKLVGKRGQFSTGIFSRILFIKR